MNKELIEYLKKELDYMAHVKKDMDIMPAGDDVDGIGISGNQAKQCLAALEGREGMILMPKELTYENGAKGLFMGEFFESLDVPAPDDHHDETGEHDITIDVPVTWKTIKRIYDKAVKHLSK